MKHYAINDLKLEKYFSQVALLDENYILLSPEISIDDLLLNRLSRWNYTHLYSNGVLVDHPTSEIESSVDNLNTKVQAQEQLDQATVHFSNMIDFTTKLFNDFINSGQLSPKAINEKIKDFIGTIRNLRRNMLRYNEFLSPSNYIVTQSVRSVIIGTILGLEMRLPPPSLIQFGISCLLQDIGMLKLPTAMYMSDQLLNSMDRKRIQTHPLLGFKILRSQDFPLDVCLGVLESHEHVDGSGYPQQLNGERISKYGSAIAIVSSYVAMTSERPFRISIDNYAAIVELFKKRNSYYDPSILTDLVKAISIYPIGTFVKLKNGAMGMVVETFQESPRTPRIQLLLQANGKKYSERTTMSTKGADNSIIEVISPTKAGKLREVLKLLN